MSESYPPPHVSRFLRAFKSAGGVMLNRVRVHTHSTAYQQDAPCKIFLQLLQRLSVRTSRPPSRLQASRGVHAHVQWSRSQRRVGLHTE